MLFNILLADLKEEMGQVKWGGIRLGDGRVYTLAYANDMVLIAEKENEMRSVMDRLEKYLEKKRLKLNAEKSKIMRFRKRSGRLSKRDWR